MFAAIARLIRPGASAPQAHHPLVSSIIETLGNTIAEARDFDRLINPAIESAQDYLARQIAAIPGALPVSGQALVQNPATALLFPNQDEIYRALGRSLEVKDSLPGLAERGHQHVHALLGMRSKPDPFAPGGMIFADHTIRSLAPMASDTRDYLAYVAFKRLLNSFAEHANATRRKHRHLEVEWDIRKTQAETSGHFDEPAQHPAVDAVGPDQLLAEFCTWLAAPEAYFRLEQSGISLPLDDDGGRANAGIDLPRLHCSDRRQWLVCLIRFPVEEGLQALAQETHTHRHIYI